MSTRGVPGRALTRRHSAEGVPAAGVVVDDQDVGPASAQCARERDFVGGRGQHLHVPRGLQEALESGEDGGMVVE